MFEHPVEKAERFVHGSGKGHFRRLAGGAGSVVKGRDGGVVGEVTAFGADIGLPQLSHDHGQYHTYVS